MCLPFYPTRSLCFRLPGFLISSQIRLISPCGLFVVLLFHSGKSFFSVFFLCVMGFTICLVIEKMRELEEKLNVEMGFGFWCFCDEKFAFLGFVSI